MQDHAVTLARQVVEHNAGMQWDDLPGHLRAQLASILNFQPTNPTFCPACTIPHHPSRL